MHLMCLKERIFFLSESKALFPITCSCCCNNMEDHQLVKLEKDDVFCQFLKDDFDVKSYASQSLQGALVSELLAKLVAGISILDKELHHQVSTHYEDLLSQATGIETLEGVLGMMHVRIQTLLSAVERLRTKLLDPYKKVAIHTEMLSRLQSVCDLLRCVVRVMFLTKRLHSQLQGGTREITKVAQSLNELDYLVKSCDLTGLEIIEQDQHLIRQARKDVERQAEHMLSRGLETQNQTQVATALQVFHNLRLLLPTVEKTVGEVQDTLLNNIRDALDVTALSQQQPEPGKTKGGPGRASMPSFGGAAAFRATLWVNMEKLTDQIHTSCTKVLQLQRVLAKKRDPVTHVCFMDELAKLGGESILPTFWDTITRILLEEFTKAAEESMHIKQAFEGEFPKLLRLFSDLWKRLQQFSSASSAMPDDITVDAPALPNYQKVDGFEPEAALRQTLSPFEKAYLSRSLSLLFDPINIMFSSSDGTLPSAGEVEKRIIKAISSELSVASVDPELSKTIAKNVAKTVKLFAVKCEQMLSTDGEASQVIDPPTAGQTTNANIVNLLYKFNLQVLQVVNNLGNTYSEQACNIIKQSLQAVTALMQSAIHPLLKSITDSIESIILTIHNEDYSDSTPDNSESAPNAPCSLYMRELESFVARVHSQYLMQFQCTDFILQSVHPMVCQAIELLVRHASLVRPLGSGGKMRLASDFAQMELAVAPLCRRVSDLGRSYRLLRSFRPLLFQTPDHIVQSSSVGEVIPHSTVIHFLFSRAPSDLQSPHKSAGWSLSRYSQWLDDHPLERERLLLLRGTLEAYAQSVRQRQCKEYASVYLIMLQLLQTGLVNCEQSLKKT